MSRRFKQLLYGVLYAAFWFTVIYGGYRFSLRPAPTCFDNIRNRDEEEVDCGGQYCQACEIKHLVPMQISPIQILPAADEQHSSAVIEIKNTNVTYGATEFSFDVLLYGSGTTPVYQEHVSLPVYPSELKYRLLVNIPVAYSPLLQAEPTSTAVTWAPLTDFMRPRTPVREVHTVIDSSHQKAVITGIVQNDNAFLVHRIIINTLAYDQAGAIVGISKTVVQDLNPKEERFFQIVVPFIRTVTAPTLLDPKLYIEAEQ